MWKLPETICGIYRDGVASCNQRNPIGRRGRKPVRLLLGK